MLSDWNTCQQKLRSISGAGKATTQPCPRPHSVENDGRCNFISPSGSHALQEACLRNDTQEIPKSNNTKCRELAPSASFVGRDLRASVQASNYLKGGALSGSQVSFVELSRAVSITVSLLVSLLVTIRAHPSNKIKMEHQARKHSCDKLWADGMQLLARPCPLGSSQSTCSSARTLRALPAKQPSKLHDPAGKI